jgi:diguanylate cyclase (GGDEF)-like protein
LTGLPNRRLFADRLAHTLALATRKAQKVGLLYIDLDGFKLVNDTFGHAIGDILLIQVASRLKSRVREADTLARIGGDEFTVALSDVGLRSDAIRVASQILEVLAAPFMIEAHKISIGASIGISLFPQDSADPALLFQQADSAMYAAKRSGKNSVSCYTPELGSSLCERMNLESQLRGAVGRGEITIHYQPEFDLTDGGTRLVRFEALARWTHPTLGSIPPVKFIPVAEESGVIVALGSYILEQACRDAVGWQALTNSPVQVAVNVSGIQFARKNFVEEVVKTLERTRLSPSLLQLELTESVMLSDTERAIETLMQLRNLGISLAIDDFGTGYSSLSYLQRLPFNSLKIDRSFVEVLDGRPDARRMVDSLINLAHNLNMRVIAEGVEKSEQMELIRSLGGDEVQGYLLGRPTSTPEEILRSHYSENPETVALHAIPETCLASPE